MIDYTLVCGVDRKHLEQLAMVWPTWRQHKPSLLKHKMIVFFDHEQVRREEVRSVVDHPLLETVGWPLADTDYGCPVDTDRLTERELYDAMWTNPQRNKMLAGFVHVPAKFVRTDYWLKLDSCVAAEAADDWIDPGWFVEYPAIVAHRWGFTKPSDQMLDLDRWVEGNRKSLPHLWKSHPLNLHPKPGHGRLSHKRITSWCGFFRTSFTQRCARMAHDTCGRFQIPVPSQDGFMWYMAKRSGLGIERVNMKSKGWSHRPVREFSMEAVKGG